MPAKMKMNLYSTSDQRAVNGSAGNIRGLWLLAAGCLLLVLAVWLWKARNQTSEISQSAAVESAEANPQHGQRAPARDRATPSHGGSVGGWNAPSPDLIVTGKVAQFTRSRRAIVHDLAQHFNVAVPDEAELYLMAAEAGNWEEADAIFEAMEKRQRSESASADLGVIWPAIQEVRGVAEIARSWPAGALLDYGKELLSSLGPEMVYVSGTDPGRFIPLLLEETSGGEPRAMVSLNQLADREYLQYVGFLHGDRMNTLSGPDSVEIFSSYMSDAQLRLQRQQLQPGEDVRQEGESIQISGQTAVMTLNGMLLQDLRKKNPEASFALEEGFALESLYRGAVPLGPILELRFGEKDTGLNSDHVAQSLSYWQQTSQRLVSSHEASSTPELRRAYAQMATAQANLLAHHSLRAEAEQVYRLAYELAPGYEAPARKLAELLSRTGRAEEARQLLDRIAP
jgi:hypothetical protein